MRKLPVLIILTFTCFVIIAQATNDSDFRIVVFDDCKLPESAETVYSKVEIDPVVHSISKVDFLARLHLAVDQLELGVANTGTIKLKFWFLTDFNSCFRAVGFNGLSELNRSDAASVLASHMPSITSFTVGLQRDRHLNCEGIVLVSVNHGKIVATRIANFSFSSH